MWVAVLRVLPSGGVGVFRIILHFLGRFPSGQREQTVNLSAQPSEVRILPSPFTLFLGNAGIAQLARASAFQAEGRGFESRFPLHPIDRWELGLAI